MTSPPGEPKGPGVLFVESVRLWEGQREACAAIIALTLLPARILRRLAFSRCGLDGAASAAAALAAGEWRRLGVWGAGWGALLFARALCSIALILTFGLRPDDSAFGVGETFRFALTRRLKPFLWVEAVKFTVIASGCMLFLMPGILFAVRYAFSAYAVVIEGARGIAALERSRLLMNYRRVRTLAALIAVSLAAGGAASALDSAGILVAEAFRPLGMAGFPEALHAGRVVAVELVWSWKVAFLVVLYTDLARRFPLRSLGFTSQQS